MSLSIKLNQIELNNNSLNDICTSLLVLSRLDLEPNQYKLMLTPLVEFMGELIDDTSNAIFEINNKGASHE